MPYASRTGNNKQETINNPQNNSYLKSFKFKVSSLRLNPGLTLIELMIVIALIGILSSIGMYGFQSSQKKARDAQRKSDLQQVKKALEAARNDCLGGSFYPDVGGTDETTAFATLSTHLANTNLNYLSQTVNNPNNSSTYTYRYDRTSTAASACPNTYGTLGFNGTKYYILRTLLEQANDPETNSSRTKCQSTIANMSSPSWDTTNNGATPTANDGYFYVCPD